MSNTTQPTLGPWMPASKPARRPSVDTQADQPLLQTAIHDGRRNPLGTVNTNIPPAGSAAKGLLARVAEPASLRSPIVFQTPAPAAATETRVKRWFKHLAARRFPQVDAAAKTLSFDVYYDSDDSANEAHMEDEEDAASDVEPTTGTGDHVYYDSDDSANDADMDEEDAASSAEPTTCTTCNHVYYDSDDSENDAGMDEEDAASDAESTTCMCDSDSDSELEELQELGEQYLIPQFSRASGEVAADFNVGIVPSFLGKRRRADLEDEPEEEDRAAKRYRTFVGCGQDVFYDTKADIHSDQIDALLAGARAHVFAVLRNTAAGPVVFRQPQVRVYDGELFG